MHIVVVPDFILGVKGHDDVWLRLRFPLLF